MARKRVINLTANRTLKKSESGSLIVLDKADGITVTLPSPGRGLQFEFVFKTDIASGAAVITAGTNKLRGYLHGVYHDEDDAGKTWTSDGTTFVRYNANGGTTGGLKGTYIKLVCDNDDIWNISGINVSDKTSAATPLSA